MTTYKSILNEICASIKTTLIYVAIGSAQGLHPPERRTPQQYPPQIAAIPGRKTVILIDPYLESPAHIHELVDPDSDVNIYELRQSFHFSRYPSAKEDVAFLDALCQLALRPGGPYLIVHDFSGRDIRDVLPIDRFGPNILKKVLYDMSYDGGGCFLDFNTVSIMLDTDGNFIQPFYSPLWVLKDQGCPTHLLKEEIKSRHTAATNYIHRLIRIKTGREEVRDWCTDLDVTRVAERLFYTYGVPCATTVGALRSLLTELMIDFCTIGNTHMTSAGMDAAIDGDFASVLNILRLAIESEAPQ